IIFFIYVHFRWSKAEKLRKEKIKRKNPYNEIKSYVRAVKLNFLLVGAPSSKGVIEHSIRDNLRNDDFVIEGPQTKRPANFIAELKNIEFKEAFVQFLVNDWSTQDKATLIKPTQKVFLNYQLCHSYRKSAESVIREVSEKYTCSAHEEADTKIVYHVCAVGLSTNILIKCSDTDILVILLANMKQIIVNVGENQFNVDRKIWMQLGTGNHVKKIDVCAVYRDLGKISVLRWLHSMLLRDATSIPHFIGRAKPDHLNYWRNQGSSKTHLLKWGIIRLLQIHYSWNKLSMFCKNMYAFYTT
ncbi:hypothetical protein HHI36_001287, partial [Cryptolaemus montrouzieri]